MTTPTGHTRLAGVIGDPIKHSLSPTIHNAAFDALGLDWAFLAFEVSPGNLATATKGAFALGLEGLSVTMPHKQAVIPLLDRLSPTAQALNAVNTIHHYGDELVGESTDGDGFLDALRQDEGIDPRGMRAVIFGAGGAARAVVLALAQAGAADIAIANRSPIRGITQARPADITEDVPAADLVVNATPVGMHGVHGDELPLDPNLLRPNQVVVDLVYHPLRTPLLNAARQQGAVPVTGLGMLIHQAAHAFRLWTGEDPPLEAMSAAAVAALSRGD